MRTLSVTTSGPIPSPGITAIRWVRVMRSSFWRSRERAASCNGGGVGGIHDAADLVLGQHTVDALGPLEDGLHALARRIDAVLLEPVDHVALAAHRADLDLLAAADDS